MSQPLVPQFASVSKPVIGMLHLLPLPGAPRYGGDVSAIRDAMLADAKALADGGAHALMLENFGDAPFYPGRVPACVITHMTALACEVRRRFDLPLGINVLRNDSRSALAVAHAAGAAFIRVNVLCGARVTDQGLIQGDAHDLLRERRQLGAESIKVLADVNVKHSAPLGVRPVEVEVHDVVERGGADAVIVSGSGTGQSADLEELAAVKAAAATPVFVGSGVTAGTIETLWPHADGFIVGTALKRDGVTTHAVDPKRVSELMGRVQALGG